MREKKPDDGLAIPAMEQRPDVAGSDDSMVYLKPRWCNLAVSFKRREN